MTAHRAFQFCKTYKRPTEFRRLCEIIRNHLANLNKYRDQRDRPDLSAPESLQLYLDTRFEQLKIATELELWQVCEFLLFIYINMYVCVWTGKIHIVNSTSRKSTLKVHMEYLKDAIRQKEFLSLISLSYM